VKREAGEHDRDFFPIALIRDLVRIIARSYRLLCAEGISYFLLALMDFLSRAVTLLHQDLFVVKLVDIILGI
jgi:hypothetical protein